VVNITYQGSLSKDRHLNFLPLLQIRGRSETIVEETFLPHPAASGEPTFDQKVGLLFKKGFWCCKHCSTCWEGVSLTQILSRLGEIF